MTEKFKVGDNVRIVKNKGGIELNVFIGFEGRVTEIDDNERCVVAGIHWDYDVYWFPDELELIDEHSMNYTTAFKALIDGKMVEDEYGYVIRFNKDTMRFQYRTEAFAEFTDISAMTNDGKYKEYVATPKFKRGDIVEYDDEYARVFKINDDKTYDITMQPSRYANGNIVIQGKSEEELKEVQ